MSTSKEQLKNPFGSVVENTGSTARDHLANERTFLVRLSVA